VIYTWFVRDSNKPGDTFAIKENFSETTRVRKLYFQVYQPCISGFTCTSDEDLNAMSSSLKSNFTDNFGLSNKLKRVKLPPLHYKVEVFSILSLQEKNTSHVMFPAEGYFAPHLMQ